MYYVVCRLLERIVGTQSFGASIVGSIVFMLRGMFTTSR
jgi:hypothetical protein